MPGSNFSIGIFIFPGVTQLDFTGPFEVFSRIPNAKVFLFAQTKGPITTESGMKFLPDYDFATCPDLDILLVPGGSGTTLLMEEFEVLDFLKSKAENSKFITSVCTGSLVLAAAGLLDGYKATTHWLSLDVLKLFPVQISGERFVRDRNRITGGGVTAGIDFALFLTAEFFGTELAEEIQLMIEYNPAPPFTSGHPTTATSHLVEKVKVSRETAQNRRKAAAIRVLEARTKN
ncbi:DJ-1/PfpI family protein [Leptospira kmetyi]|uniref:DJ-1/PfpI family protein n=1 Tax=Leptospira kmetyi TaxID=408139 RepID=A0A2M9XJY6_9LEPT|nr:DJ-1/PfpI family protein [Leptospira kmetyi]AYV55408.1 DJ-1/PfpI family protein [Leptospira kmetyi]EQA52229.1 putative cyclohexyl-isocyanide hydratase [Leptospira kmetyi serovar Malaysia str. Bejo-Iso9]PJZ28830.1 thiamine biosynthesis protein ThiJ [Leptospira kmetyi]PJZ39607.1 thiamine biosynthesis protein ThiJ [Leptospira kmetyi]TGK16794.1 DJ-1/PfpI family protein [Leptospira kmetyi]